MKTDVKKKTKQKNGKLQKPRNVNNYQALLLCYGASLKTQSQNKVNTQVI